MLIPALIALSLAQTSSESGPMLLRRPAMNKTTIVFNYAGHLWSVPRAGGRATRLTSSRGIETAPFFSPDGSMLAFSGTAEGSADVYVMPSTGGQPKRLTFHAAQEGVVGWTPDGSKVVFTSNRLSNTDLPRLFSIPVTGGMPSALPFPSGIAASFNSDGTKIAYMPGMRWQEAWKRYRGGQSTPIWIGNLADSKVTEIPRKNWNDDNPVWSGSKIYYVSDQTGPSGIYTYDTTTGTEKVCVPGEGFDIKAMTGGPGGLVYEQLGSINIYDFATGKAHKVPIEVKGDFTESRPVYKQLAPYITNATISPSGSRVAVEARGRIFTVPAAKGDIHDLTQKDGIAERFPAWSPDGKTIAFVSDESGEYKLVLKNAADGTEKTMSLGDPPNYYYTLVWSPDSAKIAYTDCKDNLWYVDVTSGKNVKVDTTTYFSLVRRMEPSWSPDSKWIAYDRDAASFQNSIYLFSLETSKSTQVTDGLSDARHPIFDHNGKYLYFTADTDTAGAIGWLDLTAYQSLNQNANIYCVVLRRDLADPLAPESDEEPLKDGAKPKEESKTGIDLDGIGQRVIALPMPTTNYAGLLQGPAGSFFALGVSPVSSVVSPAATTLYKFDTASRTPSVFSQNIGGAAVNADGSKILLLQTPMLSLVPTAMPPAPGQGALNLSGMTAKIDPRAEWKQMFHEVWRIERDFFYTTTYHGQNLATLEARYRPFLDNIQTRADLNYLFTDMLGEMTVGHMYISGGDIPGSRGTVGGVLGADFEMANNRYRLTKVYSGENWNPQLRAPLTQPGVYAKAGEYLLAVDGKNLTANDNLDEMLEAKAGVQVKIKLGPTPDGANSREAIVVPVAEDLSLRRLAWEEDNRRKVAELSGGKLGYLHLPDTNIGGWLNFNRYYYTQLDKPGMVIDERFNHGGEVDNYFVEQMNRHVNSVWMTRYGKDMTSPAAANFGPKVLLINQYAGSGGDYLPWHFRQEKLGPLVGKRTWGGLVGILEYPPLVDGGSVTSPSLAFYNPQGTWDVENHGVDPDIEVEIDPYLWRQGRDTQLEKAVQVAMDLLAKTPAPSIKRPPFMDKSKVGG